MPTAYETYLAAKSGSQETAYQRYLREKLAAGRVQSPGVVAPTNPPPPSIRQGTGDFRQIERGGYTGEPMGVGDLRMIERSESGARVPQGDASLLNPSSVFTGLVSKIATLGERANRGLIRPVAEKHARIQDVVEPGGERLASRGLEYAARMSGDFAVEGIPGFANRMVNPSEYGSTIGGQVKEAGSGLIGGIKKAGAQIGEEIHRTTQDLGVRGEENPMRQVYHDLGADKTFDEAIREYEQDPSGWLQTAMVAKGLGQTGAGMVRGLKPRTAVPEKAPIVPETAPVDVPRETPFEGPISISQAMRDAEKLTVIRKERARRGAQEPMIQKQFGDVNKMVEGKMVNQFPDVGNMVEPVSGGVPNQLQIIRHGQTHIIPVNELGGYLTDEFGVSADVSIGKEGILVKTKTHQSANTIRRAFSDYDVIVGAKGGDRINQTILIREKKTNARDTRRNTLELRPTTGDVTEGHIGLQRPDVSGRPNELRIGNGRTVEPREGASGVGETQPPRQERYAEIRDAETTHNTSGQVAAPVSPAKQPWAMTQSEFIRGETDKYIKDMREFAPEQVAKIEQSKKLSFEDFVAQNATDEIGGSMRHMREVDKALASGKPVPPEVLADYPDLKPAVSPQAAKQPTVKTWYAGHGEGKPTGKYLYVTDNPEYAKQFGEVKPYSVKPENTADFSYLGERSISRERAMAELKKKGVDAQIPLDDDVYKPMWQWVRKYPEIADKAKSSGFDSMAFKETFGGTGKRHNSLMILDESKFGEPPVSPAKQPTVKEPTGKVRVAGAEFDLISKNPDGSITVRNSLGNEFDYPSGTAFTEIDATPKIPSTPVHQKTLSSFIGENKDKYDNAQRMAVAEAEKGLIEAFPIKEKLPIGISKIQVILNKTPRGQAQRSAMARYNVAVGNRNVPFDKNLYVKVHRNIVQSAISKGESIPPEVLADYPDLVAQGAKQPIEGRKPGVGSMPKSMAPGGSQPTTINDIRQHFETALQTPIRTGKYAGQGGRGASGIYKNKADVIRLKDYGDIETLSHEVAHSIDNKTGIKKLYSQFKDELGPLDYEPTKARPSEGFAEYLRHYLTGSGNAKALAPKFTQAFEQFLTDNPELKKTIDQGKGLFDSWRSQGAEARVSAAIAKNPSKTPIRDAFNDVKNTYLRKFFDVLTPIRHYTEAAEKAAGRKLRGEENPFDLATALKNKSSARAEAWVKDVTTDFDGKPTGDGLSTILSKVKGQEAKAVEYAYAKHGIERWNQGKNPGSDLKDLEYFVEKNKSPEFEQFSKDISAYRDRLLQYVVDAGGIDPGTAKLFREIYQSSIPLYREGFESGGVGGGTKFINSAQAIKRAHGSGRTVVNPLAGLMNETSRLIKFADERRVGNSIIDASQNFPGLGNWVEKVSLGSKATHLNVEQAVENFKKAGIDLSSMSPDELTKVLTTFGQQTHGVPSENIITRFKDGKVEAYQVNKELMEGLKGVNTPQVEGFLRFLTYPKKAIAAGATALRPSFSLLTNPLRDPWSAMMQSRIWSTTPLRSIGGMLRVGVHKLGLDSKLGLDPTKLDLMRRVGVEQAQFFNSELPKAMENAKRLIADNNRSRAMNVVRHPIDLYRAVLNTPEAGPRTAEFVNVYDKVLKETGNERTAWIEATNAYQDVTMNFSRSGSVGAYINQFIPFFNPALQEPGLIARSFRRAPVATTTKGIALMTVPTIGLWYINKDKDWYKATPTWEKSTFWLIRIGGDGDGGHTLRIPKPFLWGAMFASWPEATLDAMYKHDPQIAIDMAKQIAGNTMPPFTGAVSPFGAAIGEGGYDFFRGRQIVPQSQIDNLPPSERYGKYTTETAKQIGKFLNVSPTKVDYTIGAFTGGLGADLIQAAEKPFTEKAESQSLENQPVIGRIISRSPFVNKFYEENDKLQEKMKELKVKPQAEWTAEDRSTNIKGKQYEKIAREMSDIRKQITKINDGPLPGEAKGIQIDRLNKQMDDLAHRVLYDKTYQMPTIKPEKPGVKLPKVGPISQADIDSIPAHIQVKYEGVKSKSGEKVQMTGPARQVLKDLYAESDLYTKILESLT